MGRLGTEKVGRQFRDLSDKQVADIGIATQLARLGWGSFGWPELLKSWRVLMISEMGSGKTYECKAKCKELRSKGAPAFFFELSALANTPFDDLFGPDEQHQLEVWKHSSSDVATFFLDAFDELRLTHGNFEIALKKLAKAIGGNLSRARIVITSRPVLMDRSLFERHLPYVAPPEPSPTGDDFADMAMGQYRKPNRDQPKPVPAWRNAGLMPLSEGEMRVIVQGQGIDQTDAFITAVRSADLVEFAQRPLDLIEMCAEWREHGRFGKHHEQVEANVRSKLQALPDKQEIAPLTLDKAMQGASRLALACLLTKKLTLKYSRESDAVPASEAALDAARVLVDWSVAEQSVLLERPLFGFASYGRVRFHHRSSLEYLAAHQLNLAIKTGKPWRRVTRILFSETAQGARVVRPSMAATASWLCIWHNVLFEEVCQTDPSVLIYHGDPQALSSHQRVALLNAIVDRFGKGNWRGLQFPREQIARLAGSDLGSTINKLWAEGIENSEIREFLIRLVEAGHIFKCADIAFAVAQNHKSEEQSLAIRALISLNDARLPKIVNSLVREPEVWNPEAARKAIVALFPDHMSADEAILAMPMYCGEEQSLGTFSYYLPQKVRDGGVPIPALKEFGSGLLKLLSEQAKFDESSPTQISVLHRALIPTLAAVCVTLLNESDASYELVSMAMVCVRLAETSHRTREDAEEIRSAIENVSSELREAAFFEEDAFLTKIKGSQDALSRIWDICERGGLTIRTVKDANWIRRRLYDKDGSINDRKLMLLAECRYLSPREGDYGAYLVDLQTRVSDQPELSDSIDEMISFHRKPLIRDSEDEAYEQRQKEWDLKRQQDRQSWLHFRNELIAKPDDLLNEQKSQNTAWNLWHVMRQAEGHGDASEWNRPVLESHFGKELTEKIRRALVKYWRGEEVPLSSERPPEERNTHLLRWAFGLASVTAEAEDPAWVDQLTLNEAERACRYAPMHLNGFPRWLDDIARVHPSAIRNTLGEELYRQLTQETMRNAHCSILYAVSSASETMMQLFKPWLVRFVTDVEQLEAGSEADSFYNHLNSAAQILIQIGTDYDKDQLALLAHKNLKGSIDKPYAGIWLKVLLGIQPEDGVACLDAGLRGLPTEKASTALGLLARLFGRDHAEYAVDLSTTGFSPSVLLRLTRLVYEFVRPEDDVRRIGTFSPDARDNAESARNRILSALLETGGEEGWKAKLELAGDPMFTHFKDRARALAEEKAAHESDIFELSEAECVAFSNLGESSPRTRDEMFSLLADRIECINDELVQDGSPRVAWSKLTDEIDLRKQIAREFKTLSNGAYTVDQEAVSAEEKETDIRLRSTGSAQEAVIELKVGEKDRTASQLRAAILEQLVTKYLAPEDRRVGCLAVSIASSRTWRHPETGETLDFKSLIEFLRREAEVVAQNLGGAIRLMVWGLDLRPRLSTEASTPSNPIKTMSKRKTSSSKGRRPKKSKSGQ